MEDFKKELYDRICRTLTWYEHPEECPFNEDDFVTEEMYDILVIVQNTLFE